MISTLGALLVCFQSQGTVPYTFHYSAGADAKSVAVAGTFNGWNKNANLMSKVGGEWTLTINIPLGRHEYKFVLNDTNWIVDPNAKSVFTDGGGNTNGVLFAFPTDFVFPVSRTDGKTALSAVQFSESSPYFVRDGEDIVARVATRPGDVESVSWSLNGQLIQMEESVLNESKAIWSARIKASKDKKLTYKFTLKDGATTTEVSAKGIGAVVEASAVNFKDVDSPSVPNWAEKSVVYQIFPDRFENGDPANDPKDVVAWNAEPTYANHFGGDIKGISNRTSYLKGLNVSTIYLNPIFRSQSNHRYDTIDYLKVDPEIGTNEEFCQLTKKLKAGGIGVVLDGVFNHTATQFFAFNDVIQNGIQSKFKNWYNVFSYPIATEGKPNYEAWAGFGSMPKLNYKNAQVRKYILDVPAMWQQKAEIAGWRLDVANEVDPSFWPEFRKTVKTGDDKRWIIGEIWGDGSPWLKGDQFDSVMGYQFRSAMVDFLTSKNINGTELVQQLMGTYNSYAPQTSRQLMNLLSSHDTPRFITLCKGDEALAMLGATVQFTWPGTPSIYYGEEVGMTGAQDPENRRGMQWALATNNNPILKHYRMLANLKRTLPALQSGEPKVLNSTKDTMAFARVSNNDFVITAVNRSVSSQTVTIPLNKLGSTKNVSGFKNAFDGVKFNLNSSGTLVVRLAPKSSVVLLPVHGPVSASRADHRRTA